VVTAVTAMTLMTVPLRAYSRQGVHRYFVGPYPFNLPDEPDALSKESPTYAILEATSRVGFV
jgi:hypothetical protein